MATCPVTKIDSSRSGLRIALEACYLQLHSQGDDDGKAPVFRPFEPNSYSDFGGQPTYTSRNPINASRQMQRGRITNREASGGFTQDLTPDWGWLLQGLCFAAAHTKPASVNFYDDYAASTTVTAISSDVLSTGAAIDGLAEGHIVKLSGFTNASNNGAFLVTAVSGTDITLSAGTVDEATPPATAKVEAVGYQNSGGGSITVAAGALPRLTLDIDPTELGLQAGEWIYIGGDDPNTAFTNEVNNGFARIGSIDGNDLVLDKTDATMVAGTASALEIYFGAMIRNEKDPSLIKEFSYTLERSLGQDANNKTQGEYVKGAVANQLTLSLPTADKLTVETTFIAGKSQVYKDDGVDENFVTGVRPDIVPQHAFNSTSDIARFRLMVVDPTTSNPTNQIGVVSEATLTINNNASGLNGIGQMGFFAVSSGNFEVGGDITAYFTDVDTLKLVNYGTECTVDYAIVFENTGFIFDVPGLTLGNGRLSVEANSPITLPVSTSGYESKFGNTLTCMQFHYLPDRAEVAQV